jgi:aspartyl aminopeptidase
MGEGIEVDQNDIYNVGAKHYKTFIDRIAMDLEIKTEQIIDFELSAYDFHKPAIIGLHNEFVSSPRLDNLASSLCSLDAIVDYKTKADLSNSEVSMIILFDHEEIGSQSAQGADSNMLVEACERIVYGTKSDSTKDDYYRAIRRSFFVSADMAHAIHPNYADKHQPCHQPKIHEGIVIKLNANQRYATDSVSAAILRVLAANATPPVPLQDFIIK